MTRCIETLLVGFLCAIVLGCNGNPQPVNSTDPSTPSRVANNDVQRRARDAAPKTVAVDVETPDLEPETTISKRVRFSKKSEVESALKALMNSSRESSLDPPGGVGEIGIRISLVDVKGEWNESFNVLEGDVEHQWGSELQKWLTKHLGKQIK